MDGNPSLMDGHDDVGRAAAELCRRIPAPLAPLARIAYNYAWSWLPQGSDLFRAVDADRFELCKRNPVRLLQEASWPALDRAAADTELLTRAAEIERRIDDIVAAPPGDHGIDPAHPVGFLCAEFGVHVSLPVYSGGLGALAGDILKEASDLRVPMVAVGLMYQRGFFRQRVDAAGWQHEYWLETDPERLPAALVRGPAGDPLTIEVPLADGSVTARIWRVDVGRVPLLLLDADFGDNDPLQRWVTGRLYEGDSDTRLAQYTLLGVGGVRALRALGIEPGLLHLNEGHAALAPLELALGDEAPAGRPEPANPGLGQTPRGLDCGGRVAAHGRPWKGLWPRHGSGQCSPRTRPCRPETTPTPSSGHTCVCWLPSTRRLPVPAEELWSRSEQQTDPDNQGEPFGITQVAHAAQPDGQRRKPPSWRGRAGDVDWSVAGQAGRRGPDRPRHQRHPHPDLDRQADA